MAASQRFRPYERLHRQADFDRLLAEGARASDERLTVCVIPNGLKGSRLGIRTGRVVGSAPQRSRARRRIREAFRRCKSELPTSLDILCMAKPAIRDAKGSLESSLLSLMGRAISRLRPRQHK